MASFLVRTSIDILEHEADPNTPPATGFVRIHAVAGELHIMDSNGVDTPLGDSVPVAPPSGTENRQQYFFGELGSTGLNSGVTDQSVDGSTTSQTFYIEAEADYDIHITQVTALILDSSVSHNLFGKIANLTTGWDLKWTEDMVATLLVDKARTGGECHRTSGFRDMFGDGSSLNIVPNFASTTDEAYIINWRFDDFVPNGLRIGRGNSDKLESIVNDDLTSLIEFKVYVYGFKNIPTT